MISHHNVIVFKLFYFRFRHFYAPQKMQPKERATKSFCATYTLGFLWTHSPTHSCVNYGNTGGLF